MQNIDLIAIGKMNAAYFAQGVAEYQKRLGGFCSFRIIELPEVQIADKNASDRQIAKALQKEGRLSWPACAGVRISLRSVSRVSRYPVRIWRL
ncbi:23S rRNA (pseudouridine(1915)-N(3))-methyltransferase RlmH [Gemmiger formicilis]|nr:23S rRNA (pseudouridine(1915)-N(3))-methyltransferase RlmH [Gemmiger formicilis]